MSQYTEFFLSSPSDIVQYEMIEIAHSQFSQTWRLTRNAPDGFSAGGQVWTYCPMTIEPNGARTDLEFSIRITLGDTGTILQTELEAVRAAGGNSTRPTIVYSTFSSAAPAAPLAGPFTLEVQEVALTREGAMFECKPQILYRNRTGMLYLPVHFPSLRGFL